jgi:hypothetical protein
MLLQSQGGAEQAKKVLSIIKPFKRFLSREVFVPSGTYLVLYLCHRIIQEFCITYPLLNPYQILTNSLPIPYQILTSFL